MIELGSGSDAQRELAVQLNQASAAMRAHGGTVRRFTLSSIPGSVGLDGGPAANVLFREGRCVLIVGDETSATDHRAPAVHTARAIYARTHRRAGACTS